MDNSTPGKNELLLRYLDGELSGIEKVSLSVGAAQPSENREAEHCSSDPAFRRKVPSEWRER